MCQYTFFLCFQRAVKTMVEIIHLRLFPWFCFPFSNPHTVLICQYSFNGFHFIISVFVSGNCLSRILREIPPFCLKLISSSCTRRRNFNCHEWFSWWRMWLYLTKLILKFASLFKHARKKLITTSNAYKHCSYCSKWLFQEVGYMNLQAKEISIVMNGFHGCECDYIWPSRYRNLHHYSNMFAKANDKE